jgi:hypothetical protein
MRPRQWLLRMTDRGAQLVTVLRTPSGAPAGERIRELAPPAPAMAEGPCPDRTSLH